MNNQSSEEIKNPKLVQAMQDMLKHDNAHTRSVMAEALMESRMLSPNSIWRYGNRQCLMQIEM